ncbi:hypothetical protein [Burkholderia gladioli]|uniref:hypothetical protein n=1 Tax=Burkholderia gladioli TaxID=28095 RepID=UPI00163DE790|nr:hypothetical protein [Burkholderia gladioli]
MNCKPGDLAILISGDIPENIGVIFEIVSLNWSFSAHCGEPVWNVTGPRETRSTDGSVSRGGLARDSNLRPISGIPMTDDVTDEVVA